MKLFLIERETWKYDEYDSCVVLALDEKQAKEIAIKKSSDFDNPVCITEIDTTKAKFVHGSIDNG